MTEYTTSSEAIREFMTARERTAYWVSQHSRSNPESGFVSPSSPPSILTDSDAPSYGPSDDDAVSTHSLPPVMMLRWNDGRADVPIPRDCPLPNNPPWSRMGAPPNPVVHPPPNPMIYPPGPDQHRPRAVSHTQNPGKAPQVPSWHAQSLSYATTATPQPNIPNIPPPRSPESIMILPSRQDDQPQQFTDNSEAHAASNFHSAAPHSQSPSSHTALGAQPPRGFHQPGPIHGNNTFPRSQRPPVERDIVSPTPRRATNASETSRLISRSPPIAHSQSQPLPTPANGATRFFEHHAPSTRVQSQLPYTYSPPAIVYAPSSKHPKSRYQPPAIVYSPSHHPQGHSSAPAPSITYSHSAPQPRQPANQRQAVARPYRSAHGSQYPSPTSPVIPEEQLCNFARGRGRDESRSRSRGPSGTVGRGRSARTPVQDVRSRSPTPSLDHGSDSGSRTSGSTYYILPTPGQKVQVIVPNATSIYTSTTKSGRSPQYSSSGSGSSGVRKPFLQRIFTIPKPPHILSLHKDSNSSSENSKRLHRRHTVAGPRAQDRPLR